VIILGAADDNRAIRMVTKLKAPDYTNAIRLVTIIVMFRIFGLVEELVPAIIAEEVIVQLVKVLDLVLVLVFEEL
jgi:hypothetical protein